VALTDAASAVATIVLAMAAAAVEAALISDATSSPWLTAGWMGTTFCGNRHAVKMGSPIKLKPKTLILRRQMRYQPSVWAID
jgi:Spy/CpxP family protein refolding chaperone